MEMKFIPTPAYQGDCRFPEGVTTMDQRKYNQDEGPRSNHFSDRPSNQPSW